MIEMIIASVNGKGTFSIHKPMSSSTAVRSMSLRYATSIRQTDLPVSLMAAALRSVNSAGKSRLRIPVMLGISVTKR